MPSFNRVILSGRLTRDPELRYSNSGMAIASFSIAVDRPFKNKETGERETDFFDCRVFRQNAEFVEKYVTKGRLVIVEGRIEKNKSNDKEGNPREYTNIVCESVIPMDRNDAEQGDEAPRAAAAPKVPQKAPAKQAAPATPARRAAAPAAEEDDEFSDGDPFSDE